MQTKPIRLVQITDTHIIGEPHTEVYGLDTFASAERTLAQLKNDAWDHDLVIHSGDLADGGTAEAYRRLRSLLLPLGLPVYCVRGNHDQLEEMRIELCGGLIQSVRSVVLEPWQIIFLDSHVPRKAHGHLDADEMAALEEALGAAPHLHSLIVLHHGPLTVCPMPVCQLDNADELWALLGRHGNVRAILSGHNHCAVDQVYQGIRALVTPATSLQFEHPTTPPPAGVGFWDIHGLDRQRQAWRRVELLPDGQVVTEVVWTTGPHI